MKAVVAKKADSSASIDSDSEDEAPVKAVVAKNAYSSCSSDSDSDLYVIEHY